MGTELLYMELLLYIKSRLQCLILSGRCNNLHPCSQLGLHVITSIGIDLIQIYWSVTRLFITDVEMYKYDISSVCWKWSEYVCVGRSPATLKYAYMYIIWSATFRIFYSSWSVIKMISVLSTGLDINKFQKTGKEFF